MIGLLTIEGARPSDGQACYRVTEHTPGDGFDGRGFSLTKAWGGTDDEATGYQVFVTRPHANGVQDSCSCRGYLRTNGCKHLAAMRDVAFRGQV